MLFAVIGLIISRSYFVLQTNDAEIIDFGHSYLFFCTVFCGLILMQVFPDKMLMLFEASENMLSIGNTALRIISLSFVFAGYCIILGSVFQALGAGIMSMIVSLVRQLVILVPSAYLLSLTGEVSNVWWSFPISEIASVAISTLFIIRIYTTKIKPLSNN